MQMFISYLILGITFIIVGFIRILKRLRYKNSNLSEQRLALFEEIYYLIIGVSFILLGIFQSLRFAIIIIIILLILGIAYYPIKKRFFNIE